ncbi:pyridoxal phosphate-dependent aminotransferase [Pseudenhygromyxa sp. WMMC2535]|uniref:pyridoxal phosphate-dependent aminotransferase n=1 Tax=Pseudenhygromyxa sp. WMMC2535 TaxID=2712867 RepID=UPI0015566FDD|nr:pyridoxal phosphate-dependent aminotransferase [Pseudenhygromyxa sp. WMMC2535]NVB40443.1 pyridoxal phosphate-dependent aminotransferase [Pseudenhygromyxa sp. WMMC2535]
MTGARLPWLASRLQGFGTTIFAEMTRLANAHGAVNLGQGFPDFEGPAFIKRAAIAAIEAGHNQYCRTHGLPELNAAIAAHQRRFWGLDYDPETEVTVYAGATEAIYATLAALCEVGDEVVLFEPYYDSYRASVAMAGARERLVSLRGPDFGFDVDELRAAFSPKTRAILVNSPHNPTGKVYSRAELELIAQLCVEHDVLAITDEVYEHLVFEGEHIPLAGLPGMRERTVLISSAGKTFSFTGWKIGHTCAPAAITRALRSAHQFITFCNGTPFQLAMAEGYRAPDEYFEGFRADYLARRDKLCAGLAEVGLDVLTPAGTYFVQTDIRPLGFDDDFEFCRMLPEQVGVAAIPTSAFYSSRALGKHLVRWAFCKSDPVLDEGLRRLTKLRERRPGAR